MWRSGFGPLRALLLGGAIIGLLVGAAFVVPLLRPDARKQLYAARSRWSEHTFSRYMLVIEGDGGRCRQEMIVESERVVKTVKNTCRVSPRSVPTLFRLIESTPPSRYRCVELRCACDTVVSVATRYDPALGYPRSIRFQWAAQPNWYHRDFWQHLLHHGTLPGCRPTTFSRSLQVVALTPLP